MKPRVVLLVAAVFFCTAAFADEIYLKDNTVLKGKILRVSEKNIEYDPEGDKPFDMVPRENAKKIVYDGGQTVLLEETVETAAAPAKTEKTPPVRQKGGYLDSYLYLGALAGFADASGSLRDRENRALHSQSLQYAYLTRFDRAGYLNLRSGAEAMLMFPAIKRLQYRGFDLTGIKFGLKGRYVDAYYWATAERHDVYGGSAGFFDGYLLHYQNWAAGPSMNLVFSPRNNAFSLVLETFVVGGTIIRGNLNAAPILRDAGAYWIDKHINSSRVGGYTITGGFGPRFALNKKVPIVFGLSLTYSYTQLRLHRVIPVYNDNDRRTSIEDVGVEFSLGVHLL